MIHCERMRKAGGKYSCTMHGACKPVEDGTAVDKCKDFRSAGPSMAAVTKGKTVLSDCKYFGGKLTLPRVKCEECHGTMLDVFECKGPHGQCTPARQAVGGVKCCADCDQRQAKGEPDPIQPKLVVKIGLPEHYNCSIIEWRGETLLASRLGFTGSQVWLHGLDANYQPTWSKALNVRVPGGMIGAEDPRLFVHDGQLHVAVTGYMAKTGPQITSQLLVRLNDRLEVEKTWVPQYAKRHTWEKNWQPFSYDGAIHFVYTIDPHVILRCEGENAIEVARTNHGFKLPKTTLRGGASPVRIGGEFYSFFHSFKTTKKGKAVYGIGLYTFAASAPFQLLRKIPRLIFTTDEAIDGWNKMVVFPCGAMFRDGKWIVSYGHQDRECRIVEFDAAEIEARLK